MVGAVTGGKALPAEVLEQILARTDGVPLFVEELTKAVLESGLLADQGDRYELAGPLPPLAIPSTLQDCLMARLDRLAPVKEVAQIGAAIGREFSYELLATVAPVNERELLAALDQLARAGLLFERIRPINRRLTPLSTRSCRKDALFNDKIDVLREEIERMRTPRFETTITSVLLLSQRHLSVGTMTVRAIVRGRALVVGW